MNQSNKQLKYNHLFHRNTDPFERIVAGEKRFEIRLNDEKRQIVKIGDKVKGVLRDDKSKYFISEIIGLSHFKNFVNLFEVFGDSISVKDKLLLRKVYSDEMVEKFGILVMHFKLLKIKI